MSVLVLIPSTEPPLATPQEAVTEEPPLIPMVEPEAAQVDREPEAPQPQPQVPVASELSESAPSDADRQEPASFFP